MRRRRQQRTRRSATSGRRGLTTSRTRWSSSSTGSGRSWDRAARSRRSRATPWTGRWCPSGPSRRTGAAPGDRLGWDSGSVPGGPRSGPASRPPGPCRWNRSAAPETAETRSDFGQLRSRSTSPALYVTYKRLGYRTVSVHGSPEAGLTITHSHSVWKVDGHYNSK